MINLYTIGFTQKKANYFFELLQKNNVSKIIDVRLNNNSQLAGFTKQDDLKYFLKTIANIDYIHLPILETTEEILKKYKKKEISWMQYELSFNQILEKRNPKTIISIDQLKNACLLCSEPEATHCHRRLVAEYFKKIYSEITIIHI